MTHIEQDSDKDAGHRQRLRQRFSRSGLDGFADYEVVELLLTLAIPRRDVKQQAKKLIQRFGNLRGILDAPQVELRKIEGIGNVTPIALGIIRAAATAYMQQSAEKRDVLNNPDKIGEMWKLRIGSNPNEVFEIGYADSACRLLEDGVETLTEGTVDRATIYPRRIVESALRRHASYIVIAHNHPNGIVEPSEQDKLLTKAITLAAESLQIKVIDHLIVSVDRIFSFRKAGLL